MQNARYIYHNEDLNSSKFLFQYIYICFAVTISDKWLNETSNKGQVTRTLYRNFYIKNTDINTDISDKP